MTWRPSLTWEERGFSFTRTARPTDGGKTAYLHASDA
jgi:hypothetical protein